MAASLSRATPPEYLSRHLPGKSVPCHPSETHSPSSVRQWSQLPAHSPQDWKQCRSRLPCLPSPSVHIAPTQRVQFPFAPPRAASIRSPLLPPHPPPNRTRTLLNSSTQYTSYAS